jgi:hypothetical protein
VSTGAYSYSNIKYSCTPLITYLSRVRWQCLRCRIRTKYINIFYQVRIRWQCLRCRIRIRIPHSVVARQGAPHEFYSVSSTVSSHFTSCVLCCPVAAVVVVPVVAMPPKKKPPPSYTDNKEDLVSSLKKAKTMPLKPDWEFHKPVPLNAEEWQIWLRTRQHMQDREAVNQVLKQQAVVVTQLVLSSAMVAAEMYSDDSDDDLVVQPKLDHRNLPRAERKVYRHALCEEFLQVNYLSPTPLFDGKEFDTMFRISRARFERIRQDVGNRNIAFYTQITDRMGKVGASMEARLLLALKTMAYGVPSHMLRDSFQMSKTLARKCCIEFDRAIIYIYTEEYLRVPTQHDVNRIEQLHRMVHGISGMFGSLDCMHTYWKNCPYGWQGSYKGKEKRPSIVLEAICDYHLWFWHGAYGYAGTMNDLSILSMSPFLGKLVDGSFGKLEENVVPYKIGNDNFTKMFILVDGIYPPYSRFVQGIKEPILEEDRVYSKWQESCRKDIERAFGVLKGKWQCLARPMHQISLELIGARVTACLILHNMCVSDRVMEDVWARYNPCKAMEDRATVDSIRYPKDLFEKQGLTEEHDRSIIGGSNLDKDTIKIFARTDRWRGLKDEDEFFRLRTSISNLLNKAKNYKKKY